jgi:hypothetical protein
MELTLTPAASALGSANSNVKAEAAIQSFKIAAQAQQALVGLVETIQPPADSGRGQSVNLKA